MSIRLSAFVFSTCAIALVATVSGFYIVAGRDLSKHFELVSQGQRAGEAKYVEAVLDAKRFSLGELKEQISREGKLARAVISATASANPSILMGELESIRRKTNCDLVDVIPLGKSASVLGHRADGLPSGISISPHKNDLTLVSKSDLKFHLDTVGTLVLGYKLNGNIAAKVKEARGIEIMFSLSPSGAKASQSSVELESSAGKSQTLFFRFPDITSANNSRSLWGFIVYGVISLVLVAVAIFLFLHYGFLRSFQSILKRLDSGEIEPGSDSRPFAIREMRKLSEAISDYRDALLSKTRSELLGEVAAQVAHDLNGVITTLELRLDLDTQSNFKPTEKSEIRGLFARMRSITSTVGEKVGRRASLGHYSLSPETPQSEPLSLYLDRIAAEKTLQLSKKPFVRIQTEVAVENALLCSEVQPTEIQRILANLVQNAIEAVGENGTISISLSARGSEAILEIADTGSGIPPEHLRRIGERGFSFRRGGSGLGVWHAKKTIESWKGRLTIDSNVGEGTKVRIFLPYTSPPAWLATEIPVTASGSIGIVDDNPIIHASWGHRLKPELANENVGIRHFTSAEHFLLWCKKQRSDRSTFLVDFDLGEADWSGLDLIEQLDIAQQSILVTGHFESEEIRRRCVTSGTKLLPKPLLSLIPLRVRRTTKRSARREA